MTSRTPADSQGELQGAITSLYSLASIISPAAMALIFTAYTDEPGIYLPGAPFRSCRCADHWRSLYFHGRRPAPRQGSAAPGAGH